MELPKSARCLGPWFPWLTKAKPSVKEAVSEETISEAKRWGSHTKHLRDQRTQKV